MTLDEFQAGLIERQKYYGNRLPTLEWWALALAGEAGELANQAKRIWRDDGDVLTSDRRSKLILELGDVIAYAGLLAAALDVSLNDVALLNQSKIDQRFKP